MSASQSRVLIAIFALIFAASAKADDAIKRTVLQKIDFPGSTYVTVLARVELMANSQVARHTHPGIEIGTCFEGEYDLLVDGKPPQHIKAGDTYQIPANTPHILKMGATKSIVYATWVVDKDKPLASPVL
jgi:quercetin dioxygenase-like cupin family protein